MDSTQNFRLPSPRFDKILPKRVLSKFPHFLTPHGMMLPREKQPPPMYGPRGATTPAKFLQNPLARKQTTQESQHQEKLSPSIWCYMCQMGLPSEKDFAVHLEEHEQCPIDCCPFVGHPLVMDQHIVKIHPTDLYNKIKKLSTPEAIADWRSERKRRYPSVANVELLRKVKEQKLKRGERLEPRKSRFGRIEDRRNIRTGRNCHRNNSYIKNKNIVVSEKTEAEPMPNYGIKVNYKNNKENNQLGPAELNDEHGQENSSNQKKGHRKNAFKNRRKSCSIDVTIKPLHPEHSSETIIEPFSDEEDSFCGIKEFPGTGNMTEYIRAKPKNKCKENPLSGLLGMYGSDDDGIESDESDVNNEEQDQLSFRNEMMNAVSNSEEHITPTSDTAVKQNTYKENIVQFQTQVPGSSNYGKLEESILQQSEIQRNDSGEILNKKELKKHLTAICNEAEKNVIEKSTEMHESKDDTQGVVIKSLLIYPDETQSIIPTPREAIANVYKASTEINESEEDAPQEVAIERSPKYPDKRQTFVPARKQQPRKALQRKIQKSGLDYRNIRKKRPNTMLAKLLEADIRHERNVLLQCVRYVCENNFFGIGDQTAKTE